LRGYYLAIGTLAFGLGITAIINAFHEVTGGPTGLIGVPEIGWAPFEMSSRISYFYLSILMFVAFFWYTNNLVRTRTGRILRTLKNNENTAEAMGASVSKLKLQVFVISSVFPAFAGAVLGHCTGIIAPSQFSILISVELMIMMLLG